MRILICFLLTLLLFAADAPQSDLTDKQKVEMWELLGQMNALQRKAQILQQEMQTLA